jgi:hypothetical protein
MPPLRALLTKGTELMTSLYRTPVARARARGVQQYGLDRALPQAGRPEVMFVGAADRPRGARVPVSTGSLRRRN